MFISHSQSEGQLPCFMPSINLYYKQHQIIDKDCVLSILHTSLTIPDYWMQSAAVISLYYNYQQQQMSSKKNNARIEKWRSMIKEGLFADPLLLRSRIRKGIPSAMRHIAWPEIIRLDAFKKLHKKDYLFDRLISAPSSSTYQIALDIPRTFPEEQDSKILRKSLNNVLKAISIVYPRVGYCQGMNFLALRLLQILDDEQTFWILSYLFDRDENLMKNFIDPKKIEEESLVFHKLMKQHIPKIEDRFESQGIIVQIVTVKWFMTIFSSVLAQELFYRVFQVFLNEGWTVIYAVGLTLLRLNQEKILKNTLQANMLMINSELYQIGHIDDFMEEVFRFQIDKATINAHSAEYRRQMSEKSQKVESVNSSIIRNRETNNKHPVLPVPQIENQEESHIQSKSEEITFEVFGLLDEAKIKQ